jgi:hypothetical protein
VTVGRLLQFRKGALKDSKRIRTIQLHHGWTEGNATTDGAYEQRRLHWHTAGRTGAICCPDDRWAGGRT